MTSLTVIQPRTPAVTGARGLLMLAAVARDVGVHLRAIQWVDLTSSPIANWQLQVGGRADLDTLGDRLGLGPVTVSKEDLARRVGTYADMTVEAYCGNWQ